MFLCPHSVWVVSLFLFGCSMNAQEFRDLALSPRALGSTTRGWFEIPEATFGWRQSTLLWQEKRSFIAPQKE